MVAASALIGGGLAHRHDRLVGFHFEALRRFRERTWITGRWIFGSTILQWLTGNYFAVVAGVVIGPIAVGALRAVQQLLAPIQIVTLAATNVIPVIAAEKLKSGGVREMNWFLLKVSVSGGIVTAVIGVILTLGGDFWLVFLFGSKFSGYSYLIPWLSALSFSSTGSYRCKRVSEPWRTRVPCFMDMSSLQSAASYLRIGLFKPGGLKALLLGSC